MNPKRPVERLHMSRRERGSVRQLPTREQPRGREREWTASPVSPMEQALQILIEERDILRAQLEESRAFSERLMTVSEQKDSRIIELEHALAEKEAIIAELEQENGALLEQSMARAAQLAELEQENGALLEQGMSRAGRLTELEATLCALAEADEKLETILHKRK